MFVVFASRWNGGVPRNYAECVKSANSGREHISLVGYLIGILYSYRANIEQFTMKCVSGICKR